MTQKRNLNLSPEQRAQLNALLQKAGIDTPAGATIPPRPANTPPPLSFAQERLWTLSQLLPGRAAYNIPVSIHLRGDLDPSHLAAALNDVVARHDVLRTTFSTERQAPRQTIHPALTIGLPLVNLHPLPAAERDAELQRLEAKTAQTPIDITTAPLLRARLVRLGPAEHVFLLTIHHIIADGWSLAVLFRELSQAYTARRSGRKPNLAPLPLQYADYAHWERERTRTEAVTAQKATWVQQLQGGDPLTTLPSDRPRPGQPTFQGRWLSRVLPDALAHSVKALARQEDVTLLVTLLAAFNLLLHRTTGATDILVGSPVTNRRRRELEGLIGHFVNYQPLRTDLSGRPTVRQLLQRQRQVVLDAYANQEVPFEFLLDALNVERTLNKHPLTQMAFILQDVPAGADWRMALQLPGVVAAHRFTHSRTAKYDLTMMAEKLPAGMTVSLEYNTARYDAGAMNRLLAHYEQVLRNVVADPTRPVSHINLLTPAEIAAIHRQNDTRTDYPRHRAIHDLFAEQAARRPDAIAVRYGERTLTYRELDTQANRLAHHLRALGVGRHDAVAIFTERSPELIVGTLAILKAGAGYVPLDPQFPQRRLQQMLDAAGADVLLVQGSVPDALRTGVSYVIQLGQRHTNYPATAPPVPIGGLDPAYVMFTSGSTGRPKGIGIPHRAITRLVRSTNYVDIRPGDRVAQMANASFDAATYEIWSALLNGGCVVGVPKEVALAPRQLKALLQTEEIHSLFVTTALFNRIMQTEPTTFRSAREVMFGGEAVDPQWVRAALAARPPQRLLHVYGPTESTTFATYFPAEDVPETATNVPIGTPVANTTAYVLDEEMQLLPAGVPGELYIGGDGLALGYLNQPALTAATFVPNPFATEPGSRLYRTGDRVRLRTDGAIEFLGRLDHMIKIRGHRIEPAEIQVVLRRHPAVAAAVVTVPEDERGDRFLAAYVTLEPGPAVTPDNLRHHVAASLPDYMVPAVLLILDEMPLNPNGKIDRERLPAAHAQQRPATTAFVAPQTQREQQIAAIWADVLDLPAVGLHDNFFDLGGHSLHLMQVHERLETTFQVEISMVTLFMHPTVSAMAAHLGDGEDGKAPAGAPSPATGTNRAAKRRARRRGRS